MEQPFISIGIPIYNAEKYLDLAIQSVINQSYQNWELILVDDGSTDKSLSIAKRFETLDSRIRVISDGLNKKLPARLNQIIEEAQYDYIARMDADDIIHPQRLEIQLNHLINHPEIDLVSTSLVSINDKNTVYGYRYYQYQVINYKSFQLTYPIAHATILARKEWYLRNRYDTSYPRTEDYELWCRSSENADLKIIILPDLLYYYREEGNIDANKMLKSYTDGFRVYTKYSGGFSMKRFLTVSLKKYTVIALEKTGRLQILAKLRNKQTPDSSVIKEHQEIINSLVNNIKY